MFQDEERESAEKFEEFHRANIEKKGSAYNRNANIDGWSFIRPSDATADDLLQ